MSAKRWSCALTVVACGWILVVGLVGCDRGTNGPPLAEVTGRVTLDGKPVTTGAVAFTPDTSKGTNGPMASGPIDENGNYHVKTHGEPGAQIGWHIVTVEAVDMNSEGMKPIVSRTYARSESSPLRKEVKAGEKNVIDLELTSNP